MDREKLQKALNRLGELLRARRVAGEIAVFGGAAIVLGFDWREGTEDVDALITKGHGQVVRAQQEVGEELGLPSDWLNEQATSYLAKQQDFELYRTYPSEGQFGLRVWLAKAQYVLAMKILAARRYKDAQDIIPLARHLNLTTATDLRNLVKYYYPEEEISPERLLFLRDLVGKINAPPQP